MRCRQDITEVFSTFAKLEADRFRGWLADPQLRRSIQACQQRSPNASTHFWITYWHHLWRTQPASLGKLHLTAYLQEPCYYAAQKTSRTYSQLATQYKLADYFQEAIAQVESVLTGFDPDRGNLRGYAELIFCRILITLLRKQDADGGSAWSLLRRVRRRRLVDSLERAGLTSIEIDQYCLAWSCFNETYIPEKTTGTNHLPEPGESTWQAIAKQYNQERLRQLTIPGKPCSPKTIKQWLARCVDWIRAYRYLPVRSLTASKPEQEIDFSQTIPDPTVDESLIATLITQEDERMRQQQWFQVNKLLTSSLQQLDAEVQEVLRRRYQQGQNQVDIASAMQKSQATIWRRLNRGREALLAQLIQWSEQDVNNSTAVDRIKQMSTTLEEWLIVHYREQGLSSGMNPAEK